MKKNRLLQKAALLCAAALALPFCLGAAPESAPGGGGDTVLVEPHIMLPGPDAPTPQPCPSPRCRTWMGKGSQKGRHPCCPWNKEPSRKRTGLGLPFSFLGKPCAFPRFSVYFYCMYCFLLIWKGWD